MSNTLNFRARVTTERDRVMAAWLREQCDVSPTFIRDMFAAKSDVSGDKLAVLLSDFARFNEGGKTVGISQVEVVDTETLIATRLPEIVAALETLQCQHRVDYVLASIIELEHGGNWFVTPDSATRALVGDVLGVTFDGPVAQREGFIMRKELWPKLQAHLAEVIQ